VANPIGVLSQDLRWGILRKGESMQSPREPKDQNFYRLEVYELISECTHNGEFDKDEFDNKVSGLKAAALVDGHDAGWFMEMVSQCLFPCDEAIPSKKYAS
jgi:hypothetical protein